jgi:hypothetical protein
MKEPRMMPLAGTIYDGLSRKKHLVLLAASQIAAEGGRLCQVVSKHPRSARGCRDQIKIRVIAECCRLEISVGNPQCAW